MLNVRSMSHGDIEFAVHLANTMDWNLAPEDFEFAMELEPRGCFILLYNLEKIGIVTTVRFGKMGWFGNLIVNERYREKGGGTMLASHAVKYLKGKKVETIGLYAYTHRVPFYRRLGFEYDSDFIVLKGKGVSSPENPHMKKAEREDIKKVIAYDRSCLGVLRRKLLEPILLDGDNICYLSVEDGKIVGYIIAKVYRGMSEVGPLVCRQECSETALDLLRATINRLAGFEATMCIHEKQTALLELLKRKGFSESFRVARMFHGPKIDTDCIYMAESLERG